MTKEATEDRRTESIAGDDCSPDRFDEIRAAARPALLRGLVADWPAVRAGAQGDRALLEYLVDRATASPVGFIDGPPEIEGRFHYNPDVSGMNFARGQSTLPDFLERLLAESERSDRHALAAQGISIRATMPRFESENPMRLLNPGVAPRAWIGNQTRIATHHDPMENIGCVVAGKRRFTLFPPDQVANLYMGPFHPTPAGVAVSMVHVTAPDFDQFPRFRKALDHACVFDLEPGDAIYIPYQWYHHVEAFGPLTMLVNYWWNEASGIGGSPWDALMMGLMALRTLPPDQRTAWQAMFDYYVFSPDGLPGEHLPAAARGILDAKTPSDMQQMRRRLIDQLLRDGNLRKP